MPRISGKLTPKALGWDRNRIGTEVGKVAKDGRVELGTIVGIANDLRITANEQTGELQTGLKGQFRGVSSLGTDTGKEVSDKNPPLTVTAGVCYIPGGIQAMIEGALAQAKETDSKATVQFGLKLYAIPSTNKAGYSFDAETLVKAEEADPLDTLLAMATGDGEPAALEDHSNEPTAADGVARKVGEPHRKQKETA